MEKMEQIDPGVIQSRFFGSCDLLYQVVEQYDSSIHPVKYDICGAFETYTICVGNSVPALFFRILHILYLCYPGIIVTSHSIDNAIYYILSNNTHYESSSC